MALTILYDSVTEMWSEELTTVRRESLNLVHRAMAGDVGTGTIIVDDVDGTAGHLNDAIVGHKTLRFDEDAAGVDNTNIHTGFVGRRDYRRSSETGLVAGVSRQITVTVKDINAAAGFEIFHDGDGERPEETVDERIAWLLGSGYLDAVDNGLVESSSEVVEENSFDGQTPADVIWDCALKARFNWFLYWDPDALQISLGFFEPNTSTLYTSDLRISNVIADVDSDAETEGPTNTYYPSKDAVLGRDPEHVYSSGYLTFDGGASFRTNAGTQTAFAVRHGAMPTASVKTLAKADALNDAELIHASSERDDLTVTIEVPNTAVNDVRAGQRLQVKFSHLPGYEDWRWCRVMTKTTRQTAGRPDIYIIDLVLSPQCAEEELAQDWFGALTQQGSPNLTKYSLPFATDPDKLLLIFLGVRDITNPALAGSNGYTLIDELENANAEDGNAIAVFAKDTDGTETYFEGNRDNNVQGYAAQISGSSVAALVSATQAVEGGPESVDVNLTTGAAAITYLFVTLDLARRGGGAAVDWTTDLDTVEVANQNDVDPILFIGRQTETAAGTYNLEVSIPDNVGTDFTTYPPQFQAIAIGCEGGGSLCG